MKRLKIFIDACMIMVLFLLFLTVKANPSLHIILGFILISLIIIHLLFNGKWMLISIRNIFCGKFNSKSWNILILVIGLIAAFSICIYSGIAIYQSDYYQSSNRYRWLADQSIQFIYGLHRLSAIACVILTILHIKVHWEYIKSLFSRRMENKNRTNGI